MPNIPIIPIVLFAGLPCFLAGLALFLVGWRRRPQWSMPTCTRCGYDLRGHTPESSPQCPKCSSDLIRSIKAVRFVRGGRRRRGMLAAAFLIAAMPWLGIVASMGYQRYWESPDPGNLSVKPTAALLQLVSAKPNEPWHWQELEKRLDAGKLTSAEADTAIENITRNLQDLGTAVNYALIICSKEFIRKAWQAKAISKEKMLQFVEAYHGAVPKFDSMGRLREGDGMGNVHIVVMHDRGSDLPVKMFSELRSLKLDGQPVEIPKQYGSGLYFSLPKERLPLGEHTLEVEVESLIIDGDDAIGLDDYTSSDKWPAGLRRWTRIGKAQFTVYAKDAQLVELVSDPESDPMSNSGIYINQITVRLAETGKRLVIPIEVTPSVAIPLSFDIQLQFGDTIVDVGSYYHCEESSSATDDFLVSEIPFNAVKADVILKPNAAHVDRFVNVTKIWGKEIIIPNVVLKRVDLQHNPADAKVEEPD